MVLDRGIQGKLCKTRDILSIYRESCTKRQLKNDMRPIYIYSYIHTHIRSKDTLNISPYMNLIGMSCV